MHVTLVHVRVKPEAVDAFIAATHANHEASIREVGNRRFDVLQSPDDPARWMQPGGWLARFCADMQRVLLAELDLRLMPVAGLVAALDKESTELQ